MMKKLLLSLFIICSCSKLLAQAEYTLQLVQDDSDRYKFSIVAIPNMDINNVIFASGAIRLLITKDIPLTNFNSLIGSNWKEEDRIKAADLQRGGIGDGTKDYLYIGSDQSREAFNQTNNSPIILATFEVDSQPVSGFIEIIPENHPVSNALRAASVGADNFINVDITGGDRSENRFVGLSGTLEYDFSKEPSLSNDSFTKAEFSLTPNPNNGQFTITGASVLSNEVTIEIYNVIGQQVYRTKRSGFGTNALRFNLGQQLAPSSYLIRIQSGKNEQTLKLVLDK